MRRFRIILLAIVLTAVAVLCGVRWRAWFAMPAEPEWTADTLDIHFHTFATDSVPSSSSSLLVFGDIHSSLSHEDYAAIAARHPEISAYAQLGDFMERGYFYYAQQLVHDLDSTAFDSLPIISCIGNHECAKGIRRTLSPLWMEMFPEPANGPINFIGRSYYVDFPYVRYIVIDTNGIHDLRDFTRVVTWLKSVLQSSNRQSSNHQSSNRQSSNRKYNVVLMHHPVLSSAKGRFNLGVFTFFYRTLRRYADLVLAGHDHNYARRLPFVNLSSVTTKSRAPQDPFWGLMPFEQKMEGAFYAILTVATPTDSGSPDTTSLTLDVYTLDGTLVDTITLPCTPSHSR